MSILDFKLKGRPNVALAIPTEAYLPRKAVQSVMLMMSHCWRHGDALITGSKIATVHVARNEIVSTFLSLPENVQFLLMLDSDMVVPTNLIDVWVGREDYRFPFISAYCTRKEWPFMPVPSIYKGLQERHGEAVHVYDPVTNWLPNTGIQEADGVGMAAVCIRRDVLQAMDPPWFALTEGGEDYYFCRKLRDLRLPGWTRGVPVAIDTHIQVGHVGEYIAYPDDWFANKDAYLAKTGLEEIDIDARSPLAALASD